MDIKALATLGGVTSIFGVVCVLAYLYLKLPIFAAKRSVREVLGNSKRFSASEIVAILGQFSTDESRLTALRDLTKEDNLSRAVMDRVKKDGIDLKRLVDATHRGYTPAVLVSGIVILALGFYALISSLPTLIRDQTISYDCPPIGTFVFDTAKYLVYESSNPGVTSDDAKPYYDHPDFYGFWLDSNSAGEWQRYVIDRKSGALTMVPVRISREDHDKIASEIDRYTDVDLRTRPHSDPRGKTVGHDYVGVIDNTIGTFKKNGRAIELEAQTAQCLQKSPPAF